MNIEQFEAAAASGAFFTVEFIKRTTGEARTMNCRLGVTSRLSGGSLPYDPKAKQLLPVFDLKANDYRNINLRDLVALRLNGKSYRWVDDQFVEI